MADFRQTVSSVGSSSSPQLTCDYPSPSPSYHWQDHTQHSCRDNEEDARMGNRLSDKMRPLSPGLESVWAEEGHKEVVQPPEHQTMPPIPIDPPLYRYDEKTESRKTYCGMRKRWFFALLALIVIGIFVVALGAGLGVGLGSSTSSGPSQPLLHTQYLVGGAINPEYYSTSGAYNGSGIALAFQYFTGDSAQGDEFYTVLYFQHHSGEIRWTQRSSSGTWTGGTFAEVVANDAKNGTALSAVSYSAHGTDWWHVFYIDINNQIKQRTNTNDTTTNLWVDGPLNDAHLMAYDADTVGMQACLYGNDYGDSDYSHAKSPASDGPNGDPALRNSVGMLMWYASDGTTFQQLGWRDGDDHWSHQRELTNMNGHAGVACYTWGGTTVTYSMFVNDKNEVDLYWKDTNTSLVSTAAHPINEWEKTSASIPNTNPATSLGYTDFLYVQMADDMIYGYNITWAAEDTTIEANLIVEVEPGVSGTHFSVTALSDQSGDSNIFVFYQEQGNDITQHERNVVGGAWSSTSIAIPKE